VQYRAPGQVALPHRGQAGPNAAPHCWQKRAAGGFAALHVGQVMGRPNDSG
jgi:hypothetical protein